MPEKVYIAIDLKSFYASVECMERGLDPLTTNLVVADASRTEKTICLAVTPTLKAYGISGRARLFEVVQRVREINAARLWKAPDRQFSGSSFHEPDIKASPELSLDYITATPQMALYIEYSTLIYSIYLKYIAPEDIHVYSIDEVFIDATPYLYTYKLTPRELASKIILDILETTGVTAAAGIGTNLYLAKVAMDIWAKHISADKNGVKIAELDEMSYRKFLWAHRPLTDFWRVGRGYAKKLESYGMHTMGDIARCSLGKQGALYNEDLLYKLFGVNAELLIDHAWGWEPCTLSDVKAYKPTTNSLGTGQVLQHAYTFEKAKLVVQEMVDLLVLDIAQKRLVTDQIVMTVGYDIECLTNPDIRRLYNGPTKTDGYGRSVPKSAHGTANLGKQTSSTKHIVKEAINLFERIVNENLLIRRINITANHVVDEDLASSQNSGEQLDLFTDYTKKEQDQLEEKREKNIQQAIIKIKNRYGKNAILKGMNFMDGATSIERNAQIGGHKA